MKECLPTNKISVASGARQDESLLLRGIMNASILQLFLKCKPFQISDTVCGPRRMIEFLKTVSLSKDKLFKEENCILHVGVDQLGHLRGS